MLTVRKSKDRGHANHGWLVTNHTFSFAEYYDANQLGFRSLRVINEDFISPQSGFPMHSHQDMEIITYVVEGALQHRDNMRNSSIIKPGEVQRMSAGTGVVHSEANGLSQETTHLLQIWIKPDKENYPPAYSQKSFLADLAKNNLVLVVSRHGRDNSITINQDIDIYLARPQIAGETLFKGHFDYKWVQVIKGEVKVDVDHELLLPGDGACLSNSHDFKLQWSKNSEFLIFDII